MKSLASVDTTLSIVIKVVVALRDIEEGLLVIPFGRASSQSAWNKISEDRSSNTMFHNLINKIDLVHGLQYRSPILFSELQDKYKIS